MANERKIIYATPIAHVVDGAQVANGALSAASDIDTALDSTNLLDYPLADLILTAGFGGAPTVMTTIEIYRRDLNIVSTNDEPEPSTTYKPKLVGMFILSTATTQYLRCQDVVLGKECAFYLLNNSGQTLSADWDLTVIPKTDGT